MNHSHLILPLIPCLFLACGEPDCDTSAVASVLVTVADEAGDELDQAVVTWTSDGADPEACEATPDGWACGHEVAGEIVIAVEAVGYAPTCETVEVPEGDCHVQTQALAVVLEAEEAGVFPEDRRYVQTIFDTPEACDQALAKGLECYRIAEFCADGRAAITLTDIINPGTYALSGQQVTATLTMGDAPPVMVFTLQGDSAATDDIFHYHWERNDDPLFGLGACE